MIYVVARNLREIQVFNLNLSLIRPLSTPTHLPYSITESSNELYVGTWEGIIIVNQNEGIINKFIGCGGNSDFITSILFDPNGYMVNSCYLSNKLYLFSPNGSFTGKSITTPVNPSYIGFDSEGRFIQISQYQISIYDLKSKETFKLIYFLIIPFYLNKHKINNFSFFLLVAEDFFKL